MLKTVDDLCYGISLMQNYYIFALSYSLIYNLVRLPFFWGYLNYYLITSFKDQSTATITKNAVFQGLIGNVRIDSVIPYLKWNLQIITHKYSSTAFERLGISSLSDCFSQTQEGHKSKLTDSRASGNFTLKEKPKTKIFWFWR